MNNVTPLNEELFFEGSSIISQTDSKGIVVYANRKFYEVSGYRADEIVGKNYSPIRHPNMPKDVFEKMWKTISIGHTWNGLIKNINKDGFYYWVDTEILPIQNESEQITGYIASGREASRKNIEETELVYKKMYESQG